MAYRNAAIRLGATSSFLGTPADVTAAFKAHGITAQGDTAQTWSTQIQKGQVTWDAFTQQLTLAYGAPKSDMPGDPTAASIIAAYKAHGVVPAPQTVLDWIRSFDAGTPWTEFLQALNNAYGPATSPLPAGPNVTVNKTTLSIQPKTIAWLVGGYALLRALL